MEKESNAVFKWIASILLTIVFSLVAAWGANAELRLSRQTDRIDAIVAQLNRIEAHQEAMIKALDVLVANHQK